MSTFRSPTTPTGLSKYRRRCNDKSFRFRLCRRGDVPSINQVTKQAERLQTHDVDVVDLPVVLSRQVPRIQTAVKTAEASPKQFVGRVVELPVILRAEFPQTPCVDTIVDVPVVRQRQAPQGQAAPYTVVVLLGKFVERMVGVPVIAQARRRWSRPFPRSGPGASLKNSSQACEDDRTQVTMLLRCHSPMVSQARWLG